MYDGQEPLDDLVWDRHDEDSEEAENRMGLKTTCRQVKHIAQQVFERPATLVLPLITGGFNILYRIRLQGVSPDIVVRLPRPGLDQFADEKAVLEAATAAYVAKYTDVPVPRQFFCGRDSRLGPYIIQQYIENHGNMSARLTIPNDDSSEPHVLNPSIDEDTLEILWSKTARCLLQLSRLRFPRIGSIVEVDEGSYEVADRPITLNMTYMVRLANIPRAVLPPEGETYGTTDEWYIALAEMHIAQLVFQHNDSVTSEDDCRNKYVARQVFRRLAKQGRLSTFGFAEDNWSAQSSKIMPATLSPVPAGSHSFRLWGEDLWPGNILLDSGNIAAVIDWEFTYAAPTQFILDPPWWLPLDFPETWAFGIDNWRETYDSRLKTWLSALRRAEERLEDPGPLPVALSTYMRESWERGRFWLNYGARKSWAFDTMYWRFLDFRFFGDRGSDIRQNYLWKTRIHLLSEAEREAMEPFIEQKMNESKERIIVDWDPIEAKARLSELLFD